MESKYSSVNTYQKAGNGRLLLAFVSSVLGFLFFFVSFVFPLWNNFKEEEYFGRGEIRIGTIGLWQNCKMYNELDCVRNTGIPGIAVPQTFHCFALILFVVYCVFLFRWQRQDQLPLRLLEAAICAFFIGFLLMLSFLTWITQLGSAFQYNLSLGYASAVLSFVLMEVTFVLLFIESKKEARKRRPHGGDCMEDSHESQVEEA